MRESNDNYNELRVAAAVFFLIALVITGRLFYLQIWQYNYYSTFALSTHEIYRKLHPERGALYFQDTRTGAQYPVAINRTYYLVYAVPNEIKPTDVASTTKRLLEILDLTDTEKATLPGKIGKGDDPYEQVAKKQTEETINKLKAVGATGIYWTGQTYRYYPEGELGGNVLGFCRQDDSGNLRGSYGLEGYWDKTLTGSAGFMFGEAGAKGGWIASAGRQSVESTNGSDLLLTIDRSLQNNACAALRAGWEKFEAKSGALILMDPRTGGILALCSYPDFDPNNYSKVDDQAAFNDTAIFSAYEPGSVIKTMTMSAGVDLGLVDYSTTFVDPGVRKIDNFEIHNAQDKSYGRATMTQVLENSINTGAVWVEERVGHPRYKDYLEKFGFGEKTGVDISTEVGGDLSNLDKKGDIYGATASFGQGIMATPLQVAAAYAAIANGGNYIRPHVVAEIRHADGSKQKIQPEIVNTVMSARAAKIITGMLVSVVEKGHGKPARLPNYFLAGKTGTAQIAAKGGFLEDDTNHTFAGFAPADNPRLVLVVKYEKPKSAWAEATTAPVFKEVMQFALNYYGIAEER